MTVLRALEDDRYGDVPGGIFARTFVKSYAAEVGLDPRETVEQFLEASGKGASSVRPHTPDSESRAAGAAAASSGRLGLWLMTAGVTIIAAFVIASLRSGGSSDADDMAATRPADVAAATRPAAASNVPTTGSLRIAIHPTGPCWVSLTIDGERAFSRVLQPGEREVHVAEEELIIVVGDTVAFDFSINEQHGQLPDGSGQATVTINRDNYLGFVSP